MEPRNSSEVPLSAAFVQNEIETFHPLFSVNTAYDRINDTLVPPQAHAPRPELIKAGATDLIDLQGAIEEYQETQRARGLQGPFLDFNNPNNCTWDDVFKELDDARVRHDDSEREGLGLLRKIWRELGKRADKIDPWLDFIPDDYGLGFVRTGLVVALSLARRSFEKYDALISRTVDIIDAVTTAQTRRRNIPWDTELEGMVKGLYISVLDAIATIVRFLLQGLDRGGLVQRARGIVRNRRNQNSEVPRLSLEAVTTKVFEVTGRTDRILEAYQMKLDRIKVRTHITTEYTNMLSVRTNRQLDAGFSSLTSQNQQLIDESKAQSSELRNGQTDITNHLRVVESLSERNIDIGRAIQQDFKQGEQSLRQNMESQVEILNLLRVICQNQVSWQNEMRLENQRRSHSPVPGMPISGLLIAMRIPIGLAQSDLNSLVGQRDLFSRDGSTTRAVKLLLDQSHFIRWQFYPGSYALLVDGNDQKRATQAISAMTLLCVGLIANIKLKRDPNTTVLYFFCGKHHRQEEGPLLLIKSLIMQLLLVMNDSGWAHTIPYTMYENMLGAGNITAWTDMFDFLLRRHVPTGVTVYCIIDGVTWYENEYHGFTRDMVSLSRKLCQMALPQERANHDIYGLSSMRCSFKLMLASANGTRHIRQELGYLPERVEIKQRDWNMGKGSF